MRKDNPFKGLGIALVTPFDEEGNIDFDALSALVESQTAGGVDFICVLGTTAETPCLSEDEKAAVIRKVVEANRGRLPLLLGAGGNNTQAVCHYLQTADLSGLDGVLIVTPYYNKPSQEGLYRHFKAVADASPLPVVLYNVPGRTGVNLEAATTLRIAADAPNVVAVKEASGRIQQIEQIINHAPEGFEVLSGDDAITYELLSLGAVGVISVIGNALPQQFADMVHLTLDGRHADALRIHRRLNRMFGLLSADGNPAGIKSLLAVQGKARNVLRLPLVPARPETYAAIEEENKKI